MSKIIIVACGVACVCALTLGLVLMLKPEESNNDNSPSAEQEVTKDPTAAVAVVEFGRLTGASSIDWNELAKKMAVIALRKIPYIGQALAALVSFCWPPSEKQDIWDTLKDRVVAVVDSKILDFEISERQEELQGFKKTLERYASAGNSERGAMMASMLTNADTMFEKLRSSPNALHLLPFVAVFAQIHMTLLAERYHHGSEIFPGDQNEAWWLKELQDTYTEYVTHLTSGYDTWLAWRVTQVEAKTWLSHHPMAIPPFYSCMSEGSATDALTGATIHYSVDLTCTEQTLIRDAVFAIKDMWLNRAKADMASSLSGAFFLHYYIPGNSNMSPIVFNQLQTLKLGPYSPATLGQSYARASSSSGGLGENIDSFTLPGDVAQAQKGVRSMLVREYNSIDGIQMTYGAFDSNSGAVISSVSWAGTFSGNPKGGAPHTIDLADNQHFIGFQMMFANGLLTSVDVAKSDGTTTGLLGNRGRWSGITVDATVDDVYGLTGARFVEGSGPSGSKGTQLVELEFRYRTDPPTYSA
eukprot:c7846_g1_i1.p1 GENE.c7846_g1_i1~~c7846_g1_i1.p1  ORF type:complete len:568 (-),score=106.36 c7846_g1_i1:50-1630(-)